MTYAQKIPLYLAIAVFLFVFVFDTGSSNSTTDAVLSEQVLARSQITMYSLTTCGFCKAKAREFKELNIPFSEYYIENARYMEELNSKLKYAGFPPRGYGTPIIEVNGEMMPNNPSMERILEKLKEG